MARFYGPIGYAVTTESAPGVWLPETITERNHFGDVIEDSRRLRQGDSLNDNIEIGIRISIVADPFAYENFHAMRYIKWMGVFWKIVKIDVQRPRLILTIGGVYNGQTAGPA